MSDFPPKHGGGSYGRLTTLPDGTRIVIQIDRPNGEIDTALASALADHMVRVMQTRCRGAITLSGELREGQPSA